MDGSATYVYCVAKASGKPKTSRMPSGLPDATPPRVMDAGSSLWVVCASVPLASYGPGVLDVSLRDLTWVGDIAVAHESVVEHFAQLRNVTVVPAKLFTMFSSDDRALEEMRSRRREILASARRIAGCEEWGVRITRRWPSARVTGIEPARPASGAAFLAAKKEARAAARAIVQAAAASAEQAYATLSAIARDARRRDDAPDGAVAPPLLDAAFLVPAARRSRFKAAARKLAVAGTKSGTELTLTGPWPAYNFVQAPARS
jgi:Gas vesicle synthesis protein GvpL/GvpF